MWATITGKIFILDYEEFFIAYLYLTSYLQDLASFYDHHYMMFTDKLSVFELINALSREVKVLSHTSQDR